MNKAKTKKNKTTKKILEEIPKYNRKNLILFFKYIAERHSIYKRRFIEGMDAPWTKDLILKEYRFTNVFRDLDTGTKFWIEEIMPKCDTPSKMILNVVIYRFINNIPTIKHVGIQDPNTFDIKVFEEKVREFKVNNNRVFTNAYMVSGYWSINPGCDKITKMCTIFGWFFNDLDKITDLIMNGRNLETPRRRSENTYKQLITIKGIGKFLAYQMSVDLGYWDELVFDENSFAVTGPGAIRGVNRIFTERKGYTDEELMMWIVKIQNKVWKGININPLELFNDRKYPRLNLMAVENCFCEIDKYLRTYYGEGRPRNRYRYSWDKK